MSEVSGGDRGLSTFKSDPNMPNPVPNQTASFGGAGGFSNPFLRNSSLFTTMNLSVTGPQSWTPPPPATPKDIKTLLVNEETKALNQEPKDNDDADAASSGGEDEPLPAEEKVEVKATGDTNKAFVTQIFELELAPSAHFPDGKCLDFGQLSIEKLKDGTPVMLVRNPKTGVLFLNGLIKKHSACQEDSDGRVKVSVCLMPMNVMEDCLLHFERVEDRTMFAQSFKGALSS